jgi:uncharacterized protein (DUF433 family)
MHGGKIGMDWQERIVVDPNILVGKPTVKGTRLAVEFIIDLLAEGWSESDILSNYPGLTTQDIQACLAYASWMLRRKKFMYRPRRLCVFWRTKISWELPLSMKGGFRCNFTTDTNGFTNPKDVI